MGKPSSTLTKLLGFAALLGVVFFAAFGAGSAADLGETEADETEAHGEEPAGHETESGSGEEIDQVRGLSVSEDDLELDLRTDTVVPGRPTDLSFAIRGADGEVVRDFDVEHTKRMHLIVVRRDLTGFQHLHPEQGEDGTWTAPVTLVDPGTYRVFADFSEGGEPRTLGADLNADGTVRSTPLPPVATAAEVAGMEVVLDRTEGEHGDELSFEVTRDGEPVEVEPYLGAQGHLVALREGDLAFLHVHPDEETLSFTAEFPSAGSYRLFLQFKVDGRVNTVPFTVEVDR